MKKQKPLSMKRIYLIAMGFMKTLPPEVVMLRLEELNEFLKYLDDHKYDDL